MTYLVVLTVTSATLAGAGGHVAHRLTSAASSNLHNMTSHPLDVLFVSAFWLDSASTYWPMALLLVAVMAPIERRFGTARTVLAFAAGHVLTTTVTVIGVGVGIGAAVLPRTLDSAVDVGPSYGIATLAGVLVMQIRHRLSRRLAVTGLLACLLTALLGGGDFTDTGHVLAASVGVGIAVLERRLRASPATGSAMELTRAVDGHAAFS